MHELRGSCLCGDVKFAVDGPVEGIGQCHCSLCRKVSGTSSNAVFLVPLAQFRWVAGAERTTRFVLRNDWSVLRCNRCGSPLPQSHDGKRYWVHAGLMDDALAAEVRLHIHAASKADWDRIPEDVPQFPEWPPSARATR